MSLIERILGSSEPTDTEREYREFKQRREWERDVFDTAVKEWVLQSGLAPIMLEQTRAEYGSLDGIEEWPPAQHGHYESIEFDPRREDHREILEYVRERADDTGDDVHIDVASPSEFRGPL